MLQIGTSFTARGVLKGIRLNKIHRLTNCRKRIPRPEVTANCKIRDKAKDIFRNHVLTAREPVRNNVLSRSSDVTRRFQSYYEYSHVVPTPLPSSILNWSTLARAECGEKGREHGWRSRLYWDNSLVTTLNFIILIIKLSVVLSIIFDCVYDISSVNFKRTKPKNV